MKTPTKSNETQSPGSLERVVRRNRDTAMDIFEFALKRWANKERKYDCDECKDEGPEDGTECKKCGYMRF